MTFSCATRSLLLASSSVLVLMAPALLADSSKSAPSRVAVVDTSLASAAATVDNYRITEGAIFIMKIPDTVGPIH